MGACRFLVQRSRFGPADTRTAGVPPACTHESGWPDSLWRGFSHGGAGRVKHTRTRGRGGAPGRGRGAWGVVRGAWTACCGTQGRRCIRRSSPEVESGCGSVATAAPCMREPRPEVPFVRGGCTQRGGTTPGGALWRHLEASATHEPRRRHMCRGRTHRTPGVPAARPKWVPGAAPAHPRHAGSGLGTPPPPCWPMRALGAHRPGGERRSPKRPRSAPQRTDFDG